MTSSSIRFIALSAAILASLPAMAHVSYTGRDLGTFSGLVNTSNYIYNQATTGNYGWADAADADWGDSHKAKWFKFTLSNAATVSLNASANATATSTSVGGLIPAFSLYAGVAPSAAYDTAAVTQAYRATLGFPTEGVWNALGDFQIGNDSGVINTLSYIGSSLDGVGYLGDGVQDGSTTKTFTLAAGTYSFIVAGGDYLAQLPSNPDLGKAFGMAVAISVTAVPEPASFGLLAAGLIAVGMARRQRQQR